MVTLKVFSYINVTNKSKFLEENCYDTTRIQMVDRYIYCSPRIV